MYTGFGYSSGYRAPVYRGNSLHIPPGVPEGDILSANLENWNLHFSQGELFDVNSRQLGFGGELLFDAVVTLRCCSGEETLMDVGLFYKIVFALNVMLSISINDNIEGKYLASLNPLVFKPIIDLVIGQQWQIHSWYGRILIKYTKYSPGSRSTSAYFLSLDRPSRSTEIP